MTSVSWSKSCARPRGSQLSNPQCPNPSPAEAAAAAEAAPATTPASPTISMKVCSWHTHLPTPPHMCEARAWYYRYKSGQMGWSRKQFELISEMFFLLWKHYNLGVSMDLLILMYLAFSVFFCWQSEYYKTIKKPQCSSILKPKQTVSVVFFPAACTVIFSFWEGLELL